MLTRLKKRPGAKASVASVQFFLHKKRDMLARFFRVSHNRSVVFEPLPAIFLGHVAPVVRQDTDGERQIVLMSSGSGWSPKDARGGIRDLA